MNKYLNNLIIGKRLGLLFGIIVLIVAGGYLYTILNTNKINKEIDSIYKVHLVSVDYLIEADRDAYQSRVALSQLITPKIYEDEDLYQKNVASVRENYKQVKTRYDNFESTSPVVKEQEYTKHNNNFHTNYKTVGELTDQLISLTEKREIEKATELYYGQYSEVFEKMRNAMDQFTQISLSEAELAYNNSKDLSHSITVNSILLTLLIIGAIIGGAIILTRSITNPINYLVDHIRIMASGDLSKNISKEYLDREDEMGDLSKSFRTMIEQLKKKVDVANKLSEGETDFDVPIESEKDILGKSLKNLKTIFENFAIEMEQMSLAHKEMGDIEYQIDADKFEGVFKEMMISFNEAIAFHVNAILEMLEITQSYAEGDFSPVLREFNGKAKVANERFNLIRKNLQEVSQEFNKVSQEAQKGNLEFRGETENFQGDWKKMIEGFNSTLDAVVDPLKVAADYINRISKGDLPERIDESFAGDFNQIIDNLNKSIKAINGLVDETQDLTKTAAAGNLENRGDTDKFQGDYKQIVQGINKTLDALVSPLNEAGDVMSKIADKDMTARVKGDYKGDLKMFKDDINKAANNLEEAMLQVHNAVEQVSSASNQVASGSQQLAEGSNEQASSLEEVSSTLEQISSMIQQTSDNSNQANKLSDDATSAANEGTQAMKNMEKAINDIKESSDQTSKIVKTIDDIAFQTNLLALNAAVEAARAGEAGKGFAVVAEEVRNLAQRSAEAAKNTSEMIQESIENAEDGVNTTSEMSAILNEILNSINKVNELAGEIDAATKEQADGIEQVNISVAQMNKVTQENASNSEESASAAEELNSQAEELSGMVETFKLSSNGQRKRNNHNRTVKKSSNSEKKRPQINNSQESKEIQPEDVIPLDDDELKDF